MGVAGIVASATRHHPSYARAMASGRKIHTQRAACSLLPQLQSAAALMIRVLSGRDETEDFKRTRISLLRAELATLPSPVLVAARDARPSPIA